MKVLMLDPAGSSVQVTHNLCNHLAALGCDVDVFTAPHWERSVGECLKSAYGKRIVFYRSTQFRSYEARTVASKGFWRILRLAQHLRAMFDICSAARKFDVVHTQILPVPVLDYFFLRVIAQHTPVVCTVHELVPHMSKLRGLTGRIYGAIYRLASILFVYTNYTRDRLISEQGVSPEKVLTVPHGNLEHMSELATNTSCFPEEQTPTILFIGNIRPDKGVDVLIKAAAHLRKKVPRFKVLIAGTPCFDMTPILNSVEELGLQEFIEFDLRYLKEQDFVAYLSRAAVVALPYRRIEQSGVAIAACTFGKAIVATRCGGVEELVTEAGNGLLVPIDDPIELAQALAILLLNDEKRKLFEQRSADYARNALSWGQIALKTVAGYKAAITRQAELRKQAVADFRIRTVLSSTPVTGATDAEASAKITNDHERSLKT